jgi:hypothetical protein
VAKLLQRLFQVEADLPSNSCDWNLELGRPVFACLFFFAFVDPKNRFVFVTGRSIKAVQTPPLELLSWHKVHVTDPASPPLPAKTKMKVQVSENEGAL